MVPLGWLYSTTSTLPTGVGHAWRATWDVRRETARETSLASPSVEADEPFTDGEHDRFVA